MMKRAIPIVVAFGALSASGCDGPDADLRKQVSILKAQLAETQAKLDEYEKADEAAANKQMEADIGSAAPAASDDAGEAEPGKGTDATSPDASPDSTGRERAAPGDAAIE